MRILTTAIAAILVCAATSMLAPAAPARAAGRTGVAVHLVDCSSKREGDGSRLRPWRSLADVVRHGPFSAGDEILLRSGTTCRGSLHLEGSGAPGRPIVLGAWGRGARPTIAGGGTPDGTGAVDLVNEAWWTVQDLRVTNTAGESSTQVYRAGVSVKNRWGGALPGVVLRRLLVEDVASAPNDLGGRSREWGGISVAVDGGADDSFPGLLVSDNTVRRVGRTGISVANWTWPAASNDRVRITGNRVSHPRGDGIVLYGASRSRMDHNVVDHANDQWPCPLCGGVSPATANAGLWSIRSTDLRIDHNEAYGTKEPGGDGEGFDLDWQSQHVVFEANYAHDNAGGGLLLCGSSDVTVRFNIFQDNRRAAISFIKHAPAERTRIYNNTVWTRRIASTEAMRSVNGTNTSDVGYFNNIVYNRSGGLWQWPSDSIRTEANTLIGNHGAGAPHDARTSRKDPGLRAAGTGRTGLGSLGGYRPKARPMRGVPVPADADRDFFGKRIDPERPPRGAAG